VAGEAMVVKILVVIVLVIVVAAVLLIVVVRRSSSRRKEKKIKRFENKEGPLSVLSFPFKYPYTIPISEFAGG
jgi:NADH:ubiquinone oxidoreductase subunit 3 (subunit A)